MNLMIKHHCCRVWVALAVLLSVSLRMICAACLALVLLCGPGSPRVWAATSVDDLTGPWQLLVDDYPVATKTNVVRTYHPLQKYAGNPVLTASLPWEEGMVYLYGTVLHDESGTGYRMWYHTLRTNNNICTNWSVDLYATSTNGINWVKPALNLRSTCGSASNNMYSTRPTAGGITSVIHTPWETDPAQRYKLMNYDTGGYWGAWSSDGINVVDAPNNPVFTGGSDVGQFCWDPHTQLYRGYVKNAWYDANGLQRRAVALTTTTNITTWPKESLILWPDAFDDRWSSNSIQRTHFYGLSAFPYESMYLGFLWIFRATNMDEGNPGYLIGPIFDELVSSHDGVNWIREEGNRPPILPLGTNGAWDSCMVFTARAPVVDGDTVKVWYGGFDQMHDYNYAITHGAIGLATLRKDGFASLDAGRDDRNGPDQDLERSQRAAPGQLRGNGRLAESGGSGSEQQCAVGLQPGRLCRLDERQRHPGSDVGHAHRAAHRNAPAASAVHPAERLALFVHGGGLRRGDAAADHHPTAGEPDHRRGRVSQPGRGLLRHQSAELSVAEEPDQLVQRRALFGLRDGDTDDYDGGQQRHGHLRLRGDQCLRERDQQPGGADGGEEYHRIGHPDQYTHAIRRYH